MDWTSVKMHKLRIRLFKPTSEIHALSASDLIHLIHGTW